MYWVVQHDLLKDDTDKCIHYYIDFIYSYSFIPSIYKPTQITETTETTAILIDNILTNCDNVQHSATFVTDISDHMPTSLVSNLSLYDISVQNSMCSCKRCPSNDNISSLRKFLANVKWEEVLDNVDANQDYDTFINKTTNDVYLDLSKTFDTKDHDILLHKLDYYGFSGVFYDWFQSYREETT